LFERDSFDFFLPEFDKPWVIHLRETCCCSTNLCTWRPNTVYKNRSIRRHQAETRWMLWSNEVGPEVVDLSLFRNFVVEMWWTFLQDSTGASVGRCATTTCVLLLAADLSVINRGILKTILTPTH
jgi:hypothetical protein